MAMENDQVRESLLDHAHVLECSVAEIVDDVRGRWVTAFVVTRDDVESDAASLVDHVREWLPGHPPPDDIHVVEQLPADPGAEARERAGNRGDDRGS